MKFRLKIALCMVCLMSVLFGVGGTILIFGSFQSSLERARETSVQSFRVLANSLVVSPDSDSVPIILEQLTMRDKTPVKLFQGESLIYERGNISMNGKSEKGKIAVQSRDEQLVLSGSFNVLNNEYSLVASYDISEIYRSRNEQLYIFGIIFLVVTAICAVLSWLIARVLTNPLTRLAKTAEKIAAGDYTARSEINSSDETGIVSREFDKMSVKIEENIAELKEAVLRQERFVGSFTHELKTPMTSIIGYSDLLLSGELSAEDTADALNYIHSESRRLERLSLKLLELFTAEKEETAFVSCEISEIIEDIAAHFRDNYSEQGIEIITKCDSGELLIEPDLFRSLIMNLIDNARKAFDNGGRIEIKCGFSDKICRVTVSDNGRGIPQEALSKLTEAFYRVDKSRARTLGGAGLGLALCAKIAELHNGKITFESELGQGTTVTVEMKGGAVSA